MSTDKGNKYKINNFESKILVDMTIEKEGYDPTLLKDKSNKYIWVSCRYCGEPNRIKKSKYYDSGYSNAHKDCRRKELSEVESSWKREDVKQKIKDSYIKKYGVDHNSKIKHVVDKRKESFIKKYGVDNPSKSDLIKSKKKETCLRNNGTEFPLQNKEIYEKSKKTIKEKYNVDRPAQNKEILEKMKLKFLENCSFDNPMKNPEIVEKMKKTFKKTIEDNPEKYKLINTLRDCDNKLWDELKIKNLKEIARDNNFKSNTLRSTLVKEEFNKKYYNTYNFPKHQKQMEIKIELLKIDNNILFNDRKTIAPLELDIYLPDKKFAIEFNGSFWHSEAWLDPVEARIKHRKKLDICRSKGIKLLNIFENHWDERKDRILNLIKLEILESNENIFNEECVYSNKDSSVFIDNNSIYINKKHNIKYFNLEYNGEIVASMAASINDDKYISGNPVVLNSFCFKNGTVIKNGFEKLFPHFAKWAKSEGYDRVISWSDNCWTEGNIYKVLGFALINESDPDYFYWDSSENKYIDKLEVERIYNEDEREDFLKKTLFKMWDCGGRFWEFKI